MTNSFLQRFQSVWARQQRVQFGRVCANTLLWALLGLGLLAFADYRWELPRPVRVAALSAVAVVVAGLGLRSLLRMWHASAQPMTAAEIETAFPQLGQSVRTAVQYGRMQPAQVQHEGIAATLVTALVEDTHRRALPLTIEDIVPTRRLWLAAVALIVGLGAWGLAWTSDWEWRLATQRLALEEQPYRHLEVQPGDLLVDEGHGAEIGVVLTGRTNRTVTFFTRPGDQPDGEWTERTLEPVAAQTKEENSATVGERPQSLFAMKLDRLTKPLEYRVTAGELVTPIHRIDIRRPLRIDEIKVDLTPPSYTGQPTSTVLDANLAVLQGTQARFAVRFDKPVKSVDLIFTPRKTPLDDETPNEPETFPLAIEQDGQPSGPALGVIELTLNEDRNYSLVAEAVDGTRLPENKFRIRVREDQPPQVFFESPEDKTEVHTLAEVPMRVRVRDDYGLTRTGIVFQINSEQEVPLLAEEFATVAAAADEVAQTGKVSPTTQAALEKILPLEFFELTQKDSVMYFAYAEDNLPDNPQRTETEMRFIDIRPLKREYRVVDPDPMNGGMNGGPGLKSLEELIQRQRFALNRTILIEKRAKSGRNPDATTLEQLMQFETELAQNVRDTAQGLEARGFDDTELFYQAEAAMLQAVDSLSVAKWESATQQMKDALKALIEQRDRTASFILKNPDPARLAALRAFDRLQAQKLRRPKTDKEEARELIRRLEALVGQETAVAGALVNETTSSDDAPPSAATPTND
ncbi:MAG: hypothetical protein SH850_18370 [Planctomycetaceae bacterium]|nr:hypothetical protein [Planctomycetaceae bacterium]